MRSIGKRKLEKKSRRGRGNRKRQVPFGGVEVSTEEREAELHEIHGYTFISAQSSLEQKEKLVALGFSV